MHKLKWLLPLALFVPLLMAPSGGYPTRPTFQTVTVSSAATDVFTIAAADGEVAHIGGTSTGNASIEYAGFYDGVGTRTGYVGKAGGATSDVSIESDTGQVCMVPVNGTVNKFCNSATGGITLGGVSVPVTTAVASSSIGTTRTSTTVLTCDATLVVTAPTQSKLYSLRISAMYDQSGASTNGIQVNVGVTGTGTVIGGTAMIGSNNSVPVGGQGPTSITPGNAQNLLAFTGSATQTDSILIDALVSTGAGAATFCMNWAQASSSASATRLDAGYITLTQLN